jgi:putative two-component system response regulator
MLTADVSAETKQQALAFGAKDFVTKPFELTEVRLRIKNLLETRFLHLQLQGQNQLLEIKVRERTRDLEEARIESLQRLSLAAEFRDDATGQHTQRVGRVSALLAQALGLPDELVQLVRLAAPLHDVGKIGIADAILLKPGKLDPDEFRVMTTHTTIGGHILSGSQSPLLQLAEQIALSHHECWDGGGYPLGLRGEDIPLAGRIVSVADVFDALTHRRPYKEAWPAGDAAAEIERQGRSKFDPRVVEAFLKLLREGLLQEDTAKGEPIR